VENATYIAHQETANQLKLANDSNRPSPTITFAKNYSLKVKNNETVLFHFYIHLKPEEFINTINKICTISDNLGIPVDEMPEYMTQEEERLKGIKQDITDLQMAKTNQHSALILTYHLALISHCPNHLSSSI
jgi:hypothetical protein